MLLSLAAEYKRIRRKTPIRPRSNNRCCRKSFAGCRQGTQLDRPAVVLVQSFAVKRRIPRRRFGEEIAPTAVQFQWPARHFAMRAQPLGAVLSISIDLPRVKPRGGNLSRECIQPIVPRIAELLAATSQSATWFADDPAAHAALCGATTALNGDELALRIDADRTGEFGGRNRLAHQVVSRVARARSAGLRISTLALPGETAELPSELSLELLVKHGITAVRMAAGENRTHGRISGSGGPAPLRFGLWRVGVDVQLTGGSRFGDWRAASGIRRAIDRCIRSATPLHLVVDAAAIAANSSPLRLGGLPAILRHVERRRSAGMMQVCTIAELVSRLAAPAAPRAAGSILRAA